MQTRIKKTIIWTLAGLVGVIVAASIYIYMNMNNIAARAIERVGTNTLQAEVTVDAVDIDMANHQIIINGVTIANPEGFTGNRAIHLGQIDVKAESLSMTRLDLTYIDVEAPSVYLEINDSGTNLGTLKANAASGDKKRDKTPSGGAKKSAAMPEVVIQRFALKQPKLYVDMPQLGQKTGPIGMDAITIRGIGSKDSPAPVHQASAQVLDKVVKGALRKAAQEGYLSDLKGKVLEKLGEQGDIKDTFLKKLDTGVEDVGNSIRDAIVP